MVPVDEDNSSRRVAAVFAGRRMRVPACREDLEKASQLLLSWR